MKSLRVWSTHSLKTAKTWSTRSLLFESGLESKFQRNTLQSRIHPSLRSVRAVKISWGPLHRTAYILNPEKNRYFFKKKSVLRPIFSNTWGNFFLTAVYNTHLLCSTDTISGRITIFPQETEDSDLSWSTHAERLRVTGKNLCDAEYSTGFPKFVCSLYADISLPLKRPPFFTQTEKTEYWLPQVRVYLAVYSAAQ